MAGCLDDDAVDFAGLDVRQQAAQCGPLHIRTGEPAIVVPVRLAEPSLVLLAADECLARVALGVK